MHTGQARNQPRYSITFCTAPQLTTQMDVKTKISWGARSSSQGPMCSLCAGGGSFQGTYRGWQNCVVLAATNVGPAPERHEPCPAVPSFSMATCRTILGRWHFWEKPRSMGFLPPGHTHGLPISLRLTPKSHRSLCHRISELL